MPIIWLITKYDSRRARRQAQREADAQAQADARRSDLAFESRDTSRAQPVNAIAYGSGTLGNQSGTLLPTNDSRARLLSATSTELAKHQQ